MTKPKTATKKSAGVAGDNGSKKIAPPNENNCAVNIRATDQADAVKQIAKIYMGAETPLAMVAMSYNKDSALDINAMMLELREQHTAIDKGDISRAEHMLMSQSVALQAMFADLATRAKLQPTFEGLQCLTGLALRAQSNCRATLLALGELKFPRQATFVKQANISNGPQQVNNGGPVPGSRTEANLIPQTKLLEADHGSTTLDTGTTTTAARSDPALEAMEQVKRPSEPRRQGRGIA